MEEHIEHGPLTGIRVLDHPSALAGPYCTQLLGDLGAEVIKIERLGLGDQARGWGPPFIGKDSAYFLGTNRNKRSLTLDLTTATGKKIFEQLLEVSDVLVHNLPRESSRKNLGLDEESCLNLNSKLIWASITGFGNTGPYAERAGYDIIAQGMSGTMAVTGEPGSQPIRFPTAIADITAGIYTAMGIIAALFAREKTGKGQAIDCALLDSQVTWLAYLASMHLNTDDPVEKIGNAHPSIVPYQPFPTADNWIVVAVGSERLWQRLLELLKDDVIANDTRFRTNAYRSKYREKLIPLLTAHFQKRGAKEWLHDLESAGIPAGPIYKPEESLQDEHLLERGMIVELENPLIGKIRSLGNPIHLGGTPVTYRLPPPLLGEHTAEILKELKYSDQEIEQFKKENVV